MSISLHYPNITIIRCCFTCLSMSDGRLFMHVTLPPPRAHLGGSRVFSSLLLICFPFSSSRTHSVLQISKLCQYCRFLFRQYKVSVARVSAFSDLYTQGIRLAHAQPIACRHTYHTCRHPQAPLRICGIANSRDLSQVELTV